MNNVAQQRRDGGPYVSWHRSGLDSHDHAVTDEEFARGWLDAKGRYEGLCGHVVIPGSMLVAPGRPCERCRRYLSARSSLPAVERRMRPSQHRKPPRWRRFLRRFSQFGVHDLGSEREPRQSTVRGSRTPARAGSDPSAPVLAGHHARR
ncbi:hypothetical protein GCM10027258_39710 [Amycolatopsis stemonae]